MSVEVIRDVGKGYAVLICNTTEQAFGPAFSPYENVDAFLEWLELDARSYSDEGLRAKQIEWYALGNREDL